MHNKVKSNIWKYYLASFLGGFAFFYNAIDTLYYNHWGLSFNQVGLLLSTAIISTLIFEIPSGVFADLQGRKKSMIIASILNFIAVTCLLLGSSFNIFLIGFILWGIGTAFESGAGSSLLFDSLKFLNQENTFIKHQGRLSALFISIDLLSGFFGPILFEQNVRIPYLIAWIFGLLVIIVNLNIFEMPKIQNEEPETYKTQTIKGFKMFFKNKTIVFLTLLGFIFFVSNKSFSEIILGPQMIFFNFTLFQIGIIGLVASAIQASFSFYADTIENKLGNRKSLLLLILGIPIILFAYNFSRNYVISAVILGIYFSLVTLSEVIISNYTHKEIKDDNKRATLVSIGSMGVQGLALITLPLFGFYVDKVGFTYSLYPIIISVLLVGMFLFLKLEKHRSNLKH